MKIPTILAPLAFTLLVAGCSDNEPAPPAPGSVPSPTAPVAPTTEGERGRGPMHGATSVVNAVGTGKESALMPSRDSAAKTDATSHAADDSGRNLGEDGSQPTPLDQGESETDRTITQSIRSTVVERDDLSVNAKNVKIITRNGVVTLRGPVADARERDSIVAIANAQRGVTQVDNRLEPLQQ